MKKVGRKLGSGESYKGVFKHYYQKLKDGAAERDIPFNITLKHLGDRWEKQPICPYSGKSLTQKERQRDTCYTASLDRIDPSKGYQPRNIQWIWKPLNKMKGDLTDSEFKHIINELKNNGIEEFFRKLKT